MKMNENMMILVLICIFYCQPNEAFMRRANAKLISHNCYYSEKQARLKCTLARLDINLRPNTYPGDLKLIECVNSRLNNAALFKNFVLSDSPGAELLDLSFNRLRKLPENFFEHTRQLEKVSFRNNLLTNIPAKLFSVLHYLKELDLSNNQLVELHQTTFENNLVLTNLQLWKNQFSSFPDNLLLNNNGVEKLSLSWNKLNFLPVGVLECLPILKSLSAFKNNIKCLSPTTFQRNTLLQELHLGSNDLKILPDHVFDNLPELQSVRMWANKLWCLPRDLFIRQSKLKSVNFLLNNLGLPWSLRQQFNRGSPYRNLKKLKIAMSKYGNDTCIKHTCDYDPETFTLDCSYRDMRSTESLEDVCEKVRRLRLNGNLLDDSHEVESLTEQFPDMRMLELQNNRYSGEPHPTMLKKANYLQTIDLSSNKIQSLPEKLFDENTFLQTVKVQNNLLQSVPERLLSSNAQLYEFDARNNYLNTLPEILFEKNGMLENVFLEKNRLTKLENGTFAHNPKLKTLQLNSNSLSGAVELDFTEDMNNIEELRLMDNHITDIMIQGVGDIINDVAERINTIDLTTNNLRNLPLNLLRKTPNVEILLLTRNRIESLPHNSFEITPELRHIDLSENRLRTIPADIFHHTPQLERINLDGNTLEQLPAKLLVANPLLRHFSASSNHFSSIPSRLFINNTMLKEINLSDNIIGLKGLPEMIFASQIDLEYLALGGNQLEQLPEALFGQAPKLRQLYLQGNSLRHLPASLFEIDQPRDEASATAAQWKPIKYHQDGGKLAPRLSAVEKGRFPFGRIKVDRLKVVDLRGNFGMNKNLAQRFDGKEKVKKAIHDIVNDDIASR